MFPHRSSSLRSIDYIIRRAFCANFPPCSATQTSCASFLRARSSITAFCALAALLANTNKRTAPHFNAKATKRRTFSNARLRAKIVLLEFWTMVRLCKPRQVSSKNQPQYTTRPDRTGINVANPRRRQEIFRAYPRTCRIVLTEDTNLAMYAANAYPLCSDRSRRKYRRTQAGRR